MKKWILTLLLLVFPNIVFGDGKVFKGRDFSSMYPVHENQQRAFIAHKDGLEAMVLAVNFNIEDDEKAFWLFPVLGKPEHVKTDIIDKFPTLWGHDPIVEASDRLNILAGMQIITQPYFWPFVCLMTSTLSAGSVAGIDIHSTLEKDGLRIETLTGDSLSSLTDFLLSKNIGIERSEIQVYKDYLDGQYTLVLVTISSMQELVAKFPNIEKDYYHYSGRWPCVYVEFPTDQIYFPLKPTGTYDDFLEIDLRVLGYVKPADEALKKSWKYDYFVANKVHDDFPKKLIPFIDEVPVNYTRIKFYNKATRLKEDLYLVPAEIHGMKYAEIINGLFDFNEGIKFSLYYVYVIVIGVQSWLCAGLTGMVLQKKWFPYANLGFGNLVTLIGVHFAAKYGYGFFESELKGKESKSQRSKFIWLFALFFVLSSILSYLVVRIPFMF